MELLQQSWLSDVCCLHKSHNMWFVFACYDGGKEYIPIFKDKDLLSIFL